MQFQLPINIPALKTPIRHPDKILLIGSCFTEHMAARLASSGFQTMQNPHGILFNPLSVAHSLHSYAAEKQYSGTDLFYLNELWNSWAHHSRFSHTSKQAALENINQSQEVAAAFLRDANWIVITLGSAFQYFLTDSATAQDCFREAAAQGGVANNHRAPAAWFEKKLLEIHVIQESLGTVLDAVFSINPAVHVIFTISPVRHVRDGVAENNRSKARLIEAVHHLVSGSDRLHYFPAYELIIDVLRDYRFYDTDLVHPNHAATGYVWERFLESCIAPADRALMEQVKEIRAALAHRPRFPETEAHREFLKKYTEKQALLSQQHPYIRW